MNTNKAVKVAFSRGARATKKAFAQIKGETKPDKEKTNRELLVEIRKKLDKALEQQDRINHIGRGSV